MSDHRAVAAVAAVVVVVVIVEVVEVEVVVVETLASGPVDHSSSFGSQASLTAFDSHVMRVDYHHALVNLDLCLHMEVVVLVVVVCHCYEVLPSFDLVVPLVQMVVVVVIVVVAVVDPSVAVVVVVGPVAPAVDLVVGLVVAVAVDDYPSYGFDA